MNNRMASSAHSIRGAVLYRPLALVTALAMLLQLAAVTGIRAGDSVVRGKVTTQDGSPPPPGFVVHAAPTAADGWTQLADIAEDGTYVFPELPEGEYRFMVVTGDGTVLSASGSEDLLPEGSGVLSLIPASGITVLNLKVFLPEPMPAAAGVPPPEEKESRKKAALWWMIGGIVAATAIVALSKDESDPPVSPSVP